MDYNLTSFNRQFTLSLDGKFKGFETLRKVLGDKSFNLFLYKLSKHLSGRHGRYKIACSDVVRMRVSKHSINIYFR